MSAPDDIYLIIPKSYNTIYQVLLRLLSKISKSIIDNCDVVCNSKDKIIYQCWFLFQSAIACKEINEEEKSKFIIDYIKKQLLLSFKIDIDKLIIEDDENNNSSNCDCGKWIDVDSLYEQNK